MKITIESTSKIVELNGVPARIWEGETDTGIPVHCYVTRIGTAQGQPPAVYEYFQAQLKETRDPSPEVEAIPLRMIL